jgi:hypothetical protein
MSMPPTLETRSYWIMYVFSNHIHVSNVEKCLTIWTNMHIKAKWHKTYHYKPRICGVGGKDIIIKLWGFENCSYIL